MHILRVLAMLSFQGGPKENFALFFKGSATFFLPSCLKERPRKDAENVRFSKQITEVPPRARARLPAFDAVSLRCPCSAIAVSLVS